ncbi:RNA polymerase Rpb3/Rpb11 dimerization domain [Carpediemonas membranifera]|uniref:RNA polymerase Rpb3/Rpb11 dimerization domain n=1 Tax=Carpediemonas membranifera TaxID=201153 RepID=A0A8J6B3N0_9EUKA|nr:RNA polymerase Rpb3/Rpb11 dimerization domain [Carpediemonas membranifera]|eukprot:KAG9393604.1 RNA polymerase Rpb3/Rpb11 dimerization domain [Carpediemonas membranifera]
MSMQKTNIEHSLDYDRQDIYVYPVDNLDYEVLVEMNKSEKHTHMAMFRFFKEDSTIGCIIRDLLLENPHITFAGHRVPHPLQPELQVQVQTDGSISPEDAMIEALEDMAQMFNENVESQFAAAYDQKMEDLRKSAVTHVGDVDM